MAKIITILGATGAQGQGVVASFINDPSYKVRTITRNPSGAPAQALAAKGAEVVQGDFNDLASLKTAFAGSHIIFAVTNFFEPFAKLFDGPKTAEIEKQQGINIAQAAAVTDSLEHFIWSTLPNSHAVSGGKFSVPHFDGKASVDDYIREKEPALLAKTTFLWVTWYHTNYSFPVYTPFKVPTAFADVHVQLGSWSPETPISTIGDVRLNLGKFVRAAVEQPEKAANGAYVLAAVETISVEGLLKLWGETHGKKTKYVKIDPEAFRELWPVLAEELGVMMDYWDATREKSWSDVSGGKVLTKEDLGIQGLQTLEEGLKDLAAKTATAQ
ncbi:uncharacterized protein CTHT_0019960 [Thermochaetoides thermophila DSM 1495]|uniref:NmrA-like domain-containing protein n=1 Tax=Chaetomium thermophilum (strain DSM 1495 / CBS 144.50 / IMI 039719) TaxID=759272 RepID=G0S375_CHATD|nr:hypothetical protein CTHT_0019960 [Thermochaetoides thermophila DSM 1495]EGS22458.1 hypothetical protein CTHT_0019960 [Thermochaetoides thermophila DSM 1495]